MAKALIVSDSHGLREELITIKKRHEDEINLLIHCGDSELETDARELSGYVTVRGNMDFIGKDFPNEAIEMLGDKCVYITHGHLYDVKMSHMALAYRAEETGASFACFGHSHVAEAYEREGMIFINPGSIRLPRGTFEKTYAILEVNEGNTSVVFYSLDGKRIDHLSKEFK
ncbi:metallophosphoesterase family protein [Fictibacillus phosphorivorans]|uniref:metallophosphoesterase family protein n=1 Tax=Fictibacillus phosphorivorans TaxID=1221500 RepID=UPI00204136CB|nr:metallophosphoesterase [Fictibacillus phosphorivorans]MCM3717848.1 metallophosphoesterase [Fictibacillus phosphorivorans]MCM3775297.1 metallophosphoesterase [Fictibacillus phosphorivorans]